MKGLVFTVYHVLYSLITTLDLCLAGEHERTCVHSVSCSVLVDHYS